MNKDSALPFDIATDRAGLNNTMFQITHGLYILTAAFGDRKNGQCLDALMQVTNSPPQVAIGVNKKNFTHELIVKSGRFIANVLDRERATCPEVVRHFGFQSGHDVDKFADFAHLKGESGIPILPDAKAFYECRVHPELTLDLGTHSLFVAEVERAGMRTDGEPLTYNEYRNTIRNRR